MGKAITTRVHKNILEKKKGADKPYISEVSLDCASLTYLSITYSLFLVFIRNIGKRSNEVQRCVH